MTDNENPKTEDLPLSIAAEEEDQPVSAPTPELPGGRLAARRRELNLSLDQVSQKLKLAPRQIAAIEANDFASLAGMATVRGFIRSYAKGLDMDPDPLVKMVADESSPAVDPILRRPLPSSGFPAPRYSPIGYHRNASRRLAGVGALILIFLALLVFSGHRMGWLTLPFIDLVIASDKAPEAQAANPDESAADAANMTSADQTSDTAKPQTTEPGNTAKSGLK